MQAAALHKNHVNPDNHVQDFRIRHDLHDDSDIH